MIQLPDAAYAELLAACRDAQQQYAQMADQIVTPKNNFCRQMAERLASAIAAAETAQVDDTGGGR